MTLTQNLNKIKKPFSLLISAYILFLSSPAFANFTKAKAAIISIQTGLHGLAIVTVTLAVSYVGYKTVFNGCGIMECWKVILGGAVIAGASEIATTLVG